MSDEGRLYVKQHSPFTGSTFWIHYILGDLANWQHDYELFIGNQRLADEWPISLRAVTRAMGELAEQGYLSLVKAPAPGRLATFRFVFKGAEDMARQSGARRNNERQPGRDARQSGARSHAKSEIAPITNTKVRTERELKEDAPPIPLFGALDETTTAAMELDHFDTFWRTYPRHESKIPARKAWDKAIKTASPDRIIAGAERYRDDPNRAPSFTAHPATWLNAGRWDDDPLPARTPMGKATDPLKGRHDISLDEQFKRAIGGS